jgi:hypothetical protein
LKEKGRRKELMKRKKNKGIWKRTKINETYRK